MSVVPITLRPKGVSKGAMRALCKILARPGWDLDDRLRGAIPALSTSSDAATEVAAFCHLLADLHRNGWTVSPAGDQITAEPPLTMDAGGERHEVVKRRRRFLTERPRQKQLADATVREFLRKMETPRPHATGRVSVLDLVDDGHSLAMAFAEANLLPPPERRAALEAIIRPQIQVATVNEKCEHTGLPLLEIWRYFRHTWSLEYRPTPGRSLYLLIRNAARPKSPIIGIASLANATLQHGLRDAWIGWRVEEVQEELARRPEHWEQYRALFLEVLESARAEIRSDDLLQRLRGASGESLESGLRGLAVAATDSREEEFKQRQLRVERGERVESIRALPVTKGGEVDWRTASEKPLFVAKRAATLADLLFAARVLKQTAKDVWKGSAQGESAKDLERALVIGAREVRKIGLASRLLELNVCGAVPPYRELLGGKLVAVAVASSEVSQALVERYGGQISEIASQMAGRPVTRDPSLCVITTTSLFGKSSQYNRIRLDLGELGVVRWQEIEETEGRGTAHLSRETTEALRAISVAAQEGRHVNNLFGEGQSPRMRQIRDGLTRLELDAERLLTHGVPRMIYGLELFEGARVCLRLNRPRERPLPPLAAIAGAWRDRWLSARIQRRESLDRVARQGPETVRAELAAPEGAQQHLFRPPTPAPETPPSTASTLRVVVMTKQSKPELVKSLYRALGSCADHHDQALVSEIHIPTPVDDFIRERAPGNVLFITGNPGDGKTHLLKHLDAELRAAKVVVIHDANELREDELIAAIEHALERRGRGVAVAINEGVLHQIIHAADRDRPWVADVERQLLHPLRYRDGEGPQSDRVLVLDLSMRNNLTEAVVRRALEGVVRMSASCKGCPKATCDLQRNVSRLGEVPVARMAALLQRCASAGVHATMRDVQMFVSYMLWGERNCDAVKARIGSPARYWDNAFEGGHGPLFEAVRRHDPRKQTAPLLDHRLWRAEDSADEWCASSDDLSAHTGTTLDDRLRWFTSRKRRALFEHREGAYLLRNTADPIDAAFEEILRGGASAVRKLVRMINRFFGASAERGDLLRLWCTHRYDARPSRYAAASSGVPVQSLEILRPRPRAEIAAAVPDFHPDHCVLIQRGQADLSRGLRVDRALVAALHAAENGLSPTFRLGEPEARISGFLDKLSKGAVQDDDEIEVLVVDRDLGDVGRYNVDVANRRYTPAR